MTGAIDDLQRHFSEQRLLEARSLFISEGIDASVARRAITDLLILDEQEQRDDQRLPEQPWWRDQ